MIVSFEKQRLGFGINLKLHLSLYRPPYLYLIIGIRFGSYGQEEQRSWLENKSKVLGGVIIRLPNRAEQGY